MAATSRGGARSTIRHPTRPASSEPDRPAEGARLFRESEFQATFGESLAQTLDLRTWLPGDDLAQLYQALEAEVTQTVTHESGLVATIRQRILPRLATRPNAPRAAGVYRVTPDEIAHAHHAILFNGGVEAADGISSAHDTLAVTISQVGVCLVRYFGDSGSWVHRLYWRDLRATIADPVEEALALLEQRQRGARFAEADRRARLSRLAQRAILAYAERVILLEQSEAPWRMGHGNPVALELLSGAGYMELVAAGLRLLERLIGQHRKFLYVPRSTPERGLLTIGHALGPLEYAVIDDMTERLLYTIEERAYDKDHLRMVRAFAEEIGPQLLVGVYRVSRAAPPQLFYAHRDHVHEAALIALADSVLQEHRSFPMLIDLADTLCRTTFGPTDFNDSVHLAYLETDQPYQYLSERRPRS
ncbi:MAG: hypothetical protein QOG89_3059 [Thermomicrobiales bacterium]|nr:hypothetical protein [Thermomicrobiales bacterium]